MSRKDGKSVLVGAYEKKGIYTVEIGEHDYQQNKKAQQMCPARIIKVNKYRKGNP